MSIALAKALKVTLFLAMFCPGQHTLAQTTKSWTETSDTTRCIQERNDVLSGYGNFTVRLILAPPTTRGHVEIEAPSGFAFRKGDKITFVWGDVAISLAFDPKTRGLDPHKVALDISARELLELVKNAKIAVDHDGRSILASEILSSSSDFEPIRRCWTDKLASWHVQKQNIAAIASDPVGAPVEWLTLDDYPSEARKARKEGKVTFIWKVSADRSLSDCTIIESSGTESLDAAACAAMLRRGRYIRAALDASGNPVPAWDRRTVNWRLP